MNNNASNIQHKSQHSLVEEHRALSVAQQALKKAVADLSQFEQEQTIPPICAALADGNYA